MADLPDNATVIVQDPAGLQARANLRPPLVSGWPHTLLFPQSLNGPLNGILTPDTVNSRLTLASPYELLLPNGSAAVPSLGFTTDPTTGLYKGATTINAAVGGSLSLQIASGGQIYGGSVLNSLQLAASGAVNLTAAGTNQNITLAPSGTASTLIGGTNKRLAALNSVATVTPLIELDTNNRVLIGSALTGSNSVDIISGTAARFLSGATSLLLGTVTDSSNGRLQLATHTTSAGGIGFGTETAFYRSAAGSLRLEHTGGTSTSFIFQEGVNARLSIGTSSGLSFIRTIGANSLTLETNSTAALTLDASQNATFAAVVTGTTIRASSSVFSFGVSGGNGSIQAAGNGLFTLYNSAVNDFSRLQFGGTTASFPALKRNATQLEVRLADDSAFAGVQASIIGINGQSYLDSAASGVVSIRNSAGTDFGRLQFGGTTASFPALKRSGTELHARLADDSGFTNIYARTYFLGASATLSIRADAGSPESVVAAPVGSLYLRTDGGAGTTLYVKQSGTGNTGWAAVTP